MNNGLAEIRSLPGREPNLAIPAIGQGVKSLASGSLSVVFHVNPEDASIALGLHAFQGKPVRLEVYVEGE